MTAVECQTPRPLAELIDYAIGELSDDVQAAFEEHLFTCGFCSARLESTVALGQAIAAVVATGPATVAVPASIVESMGSRGMNVRKYRLSPGDTVACTVAPGDGFVAVRLDGVPEGVGALSVELDFFDRTAGASHVRLLEDVPVDVLSRAAILLVPGDVVRSYPRSRWTMTLRGRRGTEPVELGPFTMEHTPWDERDGTRPL